MTSRRRATRWGYKQIDELVSESAGTRLAMIYAWRYPTSINRSVMIGANPPGDFLFDTATIRIESSSPTLGLCGRGRQLQQAHQ